MGKASKTSVLINGDVVDYYLWDENDAEDGTIHVQPRTDMFGRAAIEGNHTNTGYSGYFKFFILVDGKRRRLTNAWRLFPNKEHHYKKQYEKTDVVAHIAKTIGTLKGRVVSKVNQGWEIEGI